MTGRHAAEADPITWRPVRILTGALTLWCGGAAAVLAIDQARGTVPVSQPDTRTAYVFHSAPGTDGTGPAEST